MPPMGAYVVAGPAEPRRVRLAGWLDAAAALVITMLAWPFPFVRGSGVPLYMHIALIIGTWVLVDFLYRMVSLRLWARTPMMYLLDLGLTGKPRPFGFATAASWGVAWSLALLPSLFGVHGLVDPDTGLPARLTSLITAATR